MLISPYTLIVFVVGIFFFPNVLGQYILSLRWQVFILHFPSQQGLTPAVKAWHGLIVQSYI